MPDAIRTSSIMIHGAGGNEIEVYWRCRRAGQFPGWWSSASAGFDRATKEISRRFGTWAIGGHAEPVLAGGAGAAPETRPDARAPTGCRQSGWSETCAARPLPARTAKRERQGGRHGLCSGGRQAFLSGIDAGVTPRWTVRAIVSGGRPEGNPLKVVPDGPGGELACPVLGLSVTRTNTRRRTRRGVRTVAVEHGKTFEIQSYADAGQDFAVDRPKYRVAATNRGWTGPLPSWPLPGTIKE